MVRRWRPKPLDDGPKADRFRTCVSSLLEQRTGFEPVSSRLKGEHPGPLDERCNLGASGEIRTHNLPGLSRLPLPLGYARVLVLTIGFEPILCAF